MDLTVIAHVDLPAVNLFCVGDVHCGSSECEEELFRHDIEVMANNEHSRLILNGDLLECNLKKSKGDTYHQKYPPGEQKYIMREWLKPVADKILAIQGGNHDEGRSDEDSTNIRDLAEFLGVRYTDTEMLLKVPIGKGRNGKPIVYCIYATHGWSNGRMIGSKANNLHRLSDVVLADVYCIGHTHTQIAFPDEYYVPDLHNNNVRPIRRYYVNSGSYQGRGRYPKSKGMRPTVLGAPVAVLSGKEKHIEIRMS